MGLQGSIQDFDWNYTIQHGVWLRCNSSHENFDSNLACSQRAQLSNSLEDLEKLVKTHLATVHGMYALKRKQNKFHDSHISTKEFKLGYLVLLFTLK